MGNCQGKCTKITNLNDVYCEHLSERIDDLESYVLKQSLFIKKLKKHSYIIFILFLIYTLLMISNTRHAILGVIGL